MSRKWPESPNFLHTRLKLLCGYSSCWWPCFTDILRLEPSRLRVSQILPQSLSVSLQNKRSNKCKLSTLFYYSPNYSRIPDSRNKWILFTFLYFSNAICREIRMFWRAFQDHEPLHDPKDPVFASCPLHQKAPLPANGSTKMGKSIP